jgi:hypothetical protein
MTNLQDGEMRRLYTELLRARAASGRAATVPLERIVDLMEGRGDDAERLTTLDAIMSDEATAREFETLRALTANRPAAPSSWARSTWMAPLFAAAAVLLLITMPAVRSAFGPSGDDPLRSGTQAAVLLQPPTDASYLTSRKFQWRSVAGARDYVVEILTAAGTPVFTTRTTDTTLTLPPDVRIEPRVEHRWWVTTELADGTQRRSAFRRLMVRDTK